MNREADRLVSRLAAQAIRDYDLNGEAWQQEIESLAAEIAATVEAHLESMGRVPKEVG